MSLRIDKLKVISNSKDRPSKECLLTCWARMLNFCWACWNIYNRGGVFTGHRGRRCLSSLTLHCHVSSAFKLLPLCFPHSHHHQRWNTQSLTGMVHVHRSHSWDQRVKDPPGSGIQNWPCTYVPILIDALTQKLCSLHTDTWPWGTSSKAFCEFIHHTGHLRLLNLVAGTIDSEMVGHWTHRFAIRRISNRARNCPCSVE